MLPVSVEKFDRPHEGEQQRRKFIRVIVADTQAIFRAGLRKIFALEDDMRGGGPGGNPGADHRLRQEILR